MIDFEINGRKYRTCQLNAFQQFHIARRLTPLLAKLPEILGLSLTELMKDSGSVAKNLLENLDNINLDSIADLFTSLGDADCNYVFNTCLDACEVYHISKWSRLRIRDSIMFDFLGIKELLGITINVVRDNLSDFFSSNTPISTEEATAQVST